MDATLKKAKHKGIDHVYDIHGIKHIVIDVNGNDDEELLIDTCYKLEQFLNNYCSSQNIGILPERRKDYIVFPKESNYQALHISCQDMRN
jgi:(p)ppGpp synthase/HD superfamily hydrolase